MSPRDHVPTRSAWCDPAQYETAITLKKRANRYSVFTAL